MIKNKNLNLSDFSVFEQNRKYKTTNISSNNTYLQYSNNKIYANASSSTLNNNDFSTITLSYDGGSINIYRGHSYTYTENIKLSDDAECTPHFIAFSYINELPDNYTFEIPNIGFDHSAQLPQKVNIYSNISYQIKNPNNNIIIDNLNKLELNKTNLETILGNDIYADLVSYAKYSYIQQPAQNNYDGIIHDDGLYKIAPSAYEDFHIWSASDGIDRKIYSYNLDWLNNGRNLSSDLFPFEEDFGRSDSNGDFSVADDFLFSRCSDGIGPRSYTYSYITLGLGKSIKSYFSDHKDKMTQTFKIDGVNNTECNIIYVDDNHRDYAYIQNNNEHIYEFYRTAYGYPLAAGPNDINNGEYLTFNQLCRYASLRNNELSYSFYKDIKVYTDDPQQFTTAKHIMTFSYLPVHIIDNNISITINLNATMTQSNGYIQLDNIEISLLFPKGLTDPSTSQENIILRYPYGYLPLNGNIKFKKDPDNYEIYTGTTLTANTGGNHTPNLFNSDTHTHYFNTDLNCEGSGRSRAFTLQFTSDEMRKLLYENIEKYTSGDGIYQSYGMLSGINIQYDVTYSITTTLPTRPTLRVTSTTSYTNSFNNSSYITSNLKQLSLTNGNKSCIHEIYSYSPGGKVTNIIINVNADINEHTDSPNLNN